jgi:hypothetical protein
VVDHGATSTSETVCAILVALIVLPIQLAKTLFGINADASDLVNEYADEMQELEGVSTRSTRRSDDEEDADVKDEPKQYPSIADREASKSQLGASLISWRMWRSRTSVEDKS